MNEIEKLLPTEFDAAAVSTETLHNFRFLIRDKISPVANRLATWMDDFVCTELDRRIDDHEPERDPRHSIPMFGDGTWTTADVARGLRACMVLSYIALDESLSRFVDQLVFVFVGFVCNTIETDWERRHANRN